MFCGQCGKELPDGTSNCYKCGASVNKNNLNRVNGVNNRVRDTGSVGWAILGFFIPLVGLILFLVWNKEQPRNAKMAGIGALIGAGIQYILPMVSKFISMLIY